MSGQGRRRFGVVAMWAGLLALAAADVAVADPIRSWSGKSGPFAWEVHRVACGVVGRTPSTIRAHTRWQSSPANGYVRLTFVRQVRDEDGGRWATVQRARRSTKNTALEGAEGVVHWRQWFFPLADEAGLRSRHIVAFAWFRDRPGADREELRREQRFRPCVVGGS
jgi:hypothetical protein